MKQRYNDKRMGRNKAREAATAKGLHDRLDLSPGKNDNFSYKNAAKHEKY